jgi:hypothetical protein
MSEEEVARDVKTVSKGMAGMHFGNGRRRDGDVQRMNRGELGGRRKQAGVRAQRG